MADEMISGSCAGEAEKNTTGELMCMLVCVHACSVCVCACVREIERERELGRHCATHTKRSCL